MQRHSEDTVIVVEESMASKMIKGRRVSNMVRSRERSQEKETEKCREEKRSVTPTL